MSGRWAWALGGSVVIHVALVAAAWRARSPSSEPRVVVPALREPVAVRLWQPGPPDAPPAAPLRKATAFNPGGVQGRAPNRRVTAPEDSSLPQEVGSAEQTAHPEETPGPATSPGSSGPGSGQSVAGQSGSPGTSFGGSAGGGGAELAALHQRLAEAAESCYPPAARRLRLTGQLELAFCLAADGRAASHSLAASSGSELLDRAALACILDRAAPLPVRSGCFRVPVRFGVP
jgi:TonB family protein